MEPITVTSAAHVDRASARAPELHCPIDHARFQRKARVSAHMIVLADDSLPSQERATVFSILYCSTLDDGRELRKYQLDQLLLAQDHWGEQRTSNVLKSFVELSDLPDRSPAAALTIHDVMDRRRDGQRLTLFVYLVEVALTPQHMKASVDRYFDRPLRTVARY